MKKTLFIMLKEVRDFVQDKGDLSFSLVLPILIFATPSSMARGMAAAGKLVPPWTTKGTFSR